MSLTHIFLSKIHKISPLGVNYWQDGQHFLAHLPKRLYFDTEIITDDTQNISTDIEIEFKKDGKRS